MTFIPAPGVAQCVISHEIAGHRANNVLHFHSSGGVDWTQSNIQTLANTLFNEWVTVWKNQMASNVLFESVAAVDIGTSTPVQASSTASATQAIGTGNVSPALALMVQFNIGARYRGGHPRCYLPPFESGALTANEDQWIPAALTAATNGFVTIVSSIVTALPGVTHVVPKWTYTYEVSSSGKKILAHKSGYVGPFTVNSYTANPPVRTQRRRMTAGA